MTKVTFKLDEHTDAVTVDTGEFPTNVADRLMEIAVNSYLRSAVSSAIANEKARAKREHDEAEAASLKADKKYKVTEFDAEGFTSSVVPADVIAEKIAELAKGTIRSARGKSGENKALIAMVTANVVGALKAKGKGHKDAVAMVAGDPFAFIEKSARKRAGDDADAYKAELAKLNALYVDPARAILGVDKPASTGEGEDDVDDLI